MNRPSPKRWLISGVVAAILLSAAPWAEARGWGCCGGWGGYYAGWGGWGGCYGCGWGSLLWSVLFRLLILLRLVWLVRLHELWNVLKLPVGGGHVADAHKHGQFHGRPWFVDRIGSRRRQGNNQRNDHPEHGEPPSILFIGVETRCHVPLHRPSAARPQRPNARRNTDRHCDRWSERCCGLRVQWHYATSGEESIAKCVDGHNGYWRRVYSSSGMTSPHKAVMTVLNHPPVFPHTQDCSRPASMGLPDRYNAPHGAPRRGRDDAISRNACTRRPNP